MTETFTISVSIPALEAIASTLAQIAAAVTRIAPQSAVGAFNPPADLVLTKTIGVHMSVMQLEVGQTAVGHLTFNEPTPPADGAVASDDAAIATIALAADGVTWTCHAVAIGVANISYTGTSAAPDAGPAQVPNMVVTVVAVPAEEQGDFDPGTATITGP